MTRSSPIRPKLSKKLTDKKIGRSRPFDRWFDPVIDDLSLIFPHKLALELAVRARRPQRVCELWLAGRASPNGEALAALICSDVGDRVLLALTAGCPHPWAENARAVHEISKLRKQQAEAARRLEALERGIR
jgi:hypothetical protein